MKKSFPLLAIFVALFFVFISQLTLTSCTKENTITKHDTTIIRDTTRIIDTPVVCNVQGTYKGVATASANASNAGQSSTQIYKLESDNLVVGVDASTNIAVTFGGYTNTCDSVIINSFYTSTSNYYLLKGVFNSSKTTLSGTFQNLTNTTDFGTFSFIKQ